MPGTTYRDAGVDVAGAALVKGTIARLCAATHGPQVVDMPGFFAGVFDHPPGGDSLLVASTDSVGTKVRVAAAFGRYGGLGFDLVRHCVNDILTAGARPLFFLDYIGIGEVNDEKIVAVVDGLARACRESECALIGGETAILADVYRHGDFDLVGFIVGTVKRDDVMGAGPRKQAQAGDVLVGVPSSGLHSNGYSLVRKIFGTDDDPSVLYETPPELDRTLGDELLEPHRGYLQLLGPILDDIRVMAHITGGGLPGNVPRVLPDGLRAEIDLSSWEAPPIFRLIQAKGNVDEDEMFTVFNMGVGMVLIVEPARAEHVLGAVEGSWRLGSVSRTDRTGAQRVVMR